MINITGYHGLTKIYESACTLVCRAHSEKYGKPVILKIMREDYPAPARITRYRQEYEITGSLCLEGVIRAYGIEKHKNGLIIIFEDFGGESLNKIQQTKKTALADLIDMTVKIVRSLGEIHAADIIHKDINPSNIVCNLETGQLKIIDFNFASVLSRENPTIQNPKAIEGILAYISPEQTGRMNRSLDYRTDFYSLGVMLYELLSGRLPFAGTDPSELVYSHLAVLPEPLHKLDPGIPKAVSDIVMKLLSKNAEDRYQSAKGIQADLEKYLDLVRFGDIIETFPLGTRDIPERFDIPQKLYGREHELEILARVFARVTGGHREMMLVSGYSGIGKTALVHEIYKPLTRQKGYFISGKFDQFQKNIPYSALVNAFRELSRQILTESETRLEQWKQKLVSAFGDRGRVLTDVIPELELIAGAQPDVPELPPTESRNRFNMVFQNFIRIFPDPEHPLVIFLDDLQWADSATLNLMELMMTDHDMRFLLLIGAYRDNEIHPGHPLMNFLNTLKKKSVFFHQVSLFPLRLEHVTSLVTDTLHTSGESAMPLAELLIRKTRGNPFFVSQFLKTLYHENLLVFGHEGWQWNIDDIEKMGITDNVTDLMIRKMEKMPETTRHALRMGACVGSRFDLNTLFIICEQSANETFDSLLPAIREELITPTSAPEMSHRDAIDAKPIFFSFKFLHDRIQQAAYALIDDEKKKSVHLGIGRMLMASLSEKEQAERLFELADHLNQGQDLIISDREKTELAKLNLNAARKAKSSAAYGAGLEYLKSGMKKIGQEIWTDHYDLALALSMERAELEYLNGNCKDSELWINLIWKKAKSPLEKAEAYALLVIQYTVLGRNEDAIQAAAKALELFGVYFPEEKDLNTALDAEIAEVKARTGDRPISSLLELPEMTDPENKVLMKVLMTVHTPVYFANRYKLYMWTLARMTGLSLRHGHVPESSKGYASYGNILCAGMEEYRTGYDFGMLGIKLSEKYNHQSIKCKNCLIMSMFISHWVAHIRDSEVFSNDGHQAGLESGEFQFVGYILAYGKTVNFFHQGKSLSELLEDMQKYLVFNKNVQHHLSSDIILGCRRVIRNLCGKTRDRLSFDTDEGTEAEYLRKCSEHQSFAAICLYRTIRAQALYIYGLSSYALESIMEAHELLGYIRGVFTTAEHNFYYSLILADLYPNASPENQGQYRRIMENNQEQMKTWAQTCPENFLHKYYLIAAETARISGRDEDAGTLFGKAIALAEKNEFVQDQALANELAGKFWFSKGWDEFGNQHEYMKKAHYGYRSWGADRKAKCLSIQYPWILNRTSQGDDPAVPRFSSDATGAESLDLAAIIKASQAISGEIKLKELLKKLMYIVVESAGAEKGFLISGKKHGLAVDARYLDQYSEAVPEPVPVDKCRGLCPAIVLYVARTLENVVLSNASQEGMFTRDSYVMKNMPKSVCCLPVLLHGNLTGVLYLENNQAADAFTPGRLEILKLLASQAAISMENARLYANLEEQTEHLRVAEKKYRSIFENAVEGIFQVSPEGRFMSINPALARMAGYDSPEEMMSSVTNVTEQLYVNPDDRQSIYKLLGERGEVIGFETRVYRKDRTPRWVSVSARSVKDADNNIVYTEGFITDITEHIEKEQAEKEREIAEETNKKIMASIRYASMIQNSILPNPEDVREYLPQSFFIWEPRDIVGGDIYYTDFFEGGFILAVVDCTGHGVPGAFMTMIACSGLKRIIKDEGCRDPAEILKQLNFIVKTTLHQDKKYALSDDGLDAAVCLAETGTSTLTFAGARLPLIYFRNEEVHIIKGDRQSIGYKSSDQGFNFTNHTICIEKGMLFYMYTDGFTDQLGGEKRRSFGSRRFREMLKKIVRLPLEKQREIVMQTFEEYRGDNERQDDVTVVGFGF
ncbi:MAG: AAA family ATPase [Desulfobacteraceae bacterium]|nr:AAA family ATPase [Desulfobacteraceae bacterium]